MRKGDRVQFWVSGVVHLGTVLESGRKLTVLADDGRTYRHDARSFQPTTVPRPAGAAKPVEWRKGDRVAWEDDGELQTGTVERGGSGRVVVIADGGEMRVSAPARQFRPSSKPVERDTIPTPMDVYSVTGYRRGPMSEETENFVATITRAGRKIATASNAGHGGPDMYRPCRGATFEDVKRFENDAEGWYRTLAPTATDSSESASLWITWYVSHRPYGKTAAVYVAETEEYLGRA